MIVVKQVDGNVEFVVGDVEVDRVGGEFDQVGEFAQEFGEFTGDLSLGIGFGGRDGVDADENVLARASRGRRVHEAWAKGRETTVACAPLDASTVPGAHAFRRT